MRVLTVAAGLAFASFFVTIPACTTLGTTGVSSTQSVSAQQAQSAINEANVALTAVANVIAQNITDGTMTKEEAQAALNQVRKLADQADTAQKLLSQGLVLDAKTQAELASRLISTLHKQVAAKARAQ